MAESKIELHDRLRATGLWSEAAAWKDGRIKELRATGMKKLDAAAKAWEELADKYPPEPAEPSEGPAESEPADVQPSEPTSDVANRAITRGDLDEWLEAALRHDVQKCLDQHGVTLDTDVMQELVGVLTGFCLVLEPCYWPGPRYRQDDQWLFDPLSESEPEPSAPQVAVA